MKPKPSKTRKIVGYTVLVPFSTLEQAETWYHLNVAGKNYAGVIWPFDTDDAKRYNETERPA